MVCLNLLGNKEDVNFLSILMHIRSTTTGFDMTACLKMRWLNSEANVRSSYLSFDEREAMAWGRGPCRSGGLESL